jgi:hypothetical protein
MNMHCKTLALLRLCGESAPDSAQLIKCIEQLLKVKEQGSARPFAVSFHLLSSALLPGLGAA